MKKTSMIRPAAGFLRASGNVVTSNAIRGIIMLFTILPICTACDLIQMKNGKGGKERKPVARVNSIYLYQDELNGMAPHDESKEDSSARITGYVNSWIRKQLLMSEAMKTIDINEAEIDRKVMDYRYSLIGYEFQNYYIKRHLNDTIGDEEIDAYYKAHLDNFPLKQNIIQGTYIKIKKGAPRTNRLKELIYSDTEKEQNELKSYCLSFSTAYHLADSSWIEFDKLVVNSPLAEIPNKIQFLKSYRYYETNDNDFLYFIKIDAYKISDNVSPVEFVKEDIKNIILNKRKVELARKLEDEVYENGTQKKDFEIFNR
jgi:hypothetical protein